MLKNADLNFSKGGDYTPSGEQTRQGEKTQSPAKVPKARGLPPGSEQTVAELKNLLGPLVSPLLRDAQGALDLSKIPARDFQEFKSFLKTQLSVDGIAFNSFWLDSYHRVLEKEEYEPLLRALYQEDPAIRKGNSPGDLRDPLHSFQAEIIEVSAERFVGHNLQSKEGRRRLGNILGDAGYFNSEIKVELLKAIASVGEKEGIAGSHYEGVTEQISTWNYFNIRITPEEVEKATDHALEILKKGDRQEDYLADLRKKYLERPEKVRTLPSNAAVMNGRKIGAEDIRIKFKLYEENKDRPDPLSQMRAKLIQAWLLAVDNDYWINENSMAGFENRDYLVRQLEALIQDSASIVGDCNFRNFSERVHDFLEGYIPETGEGEAYQWLRHKVTGHGLEDLFKGMPATFKAAYQELRQFSDELHYAYDMGEQVHLEEAKLKAEDPQLQQAVSHFIMGLEQSKRSLWYGYKQHKALSRLGSGAAEWFGAGDKTEIGAANEKIDGLIHQLQEAETKGDVEGVVEQLYASLREEGVLHQAMVVAEMDGIEQMFGLGQTVLIILATTALTGGIATAAAAGNAARAAAALANTVRAASAVQKIGRAAGAAVETATLAGRAAWGMKMGAWLPTAENLLAVGTGEVRQAGQDTLLSWGKDSLATGLAMGLFTPLAAHAGLALERNVVQRLMQRYLTGGVKGLEHLAGDTALDGMEEMVDAYLRLRMDGGRGGISFDRFREIQLVSGLGGGTKVGAVAHGFHAGKVSVTDSGTVGAMHATPLRQALSLQLTIPALARSAAGLTVLLNPETAFAAMGTVQDSGGGMGKLGLSLLGLGILGMVKGGKGGGKRKQGNSMGELRYPLRGVEKRFIEKIFKGAGKTPPKFIHSGNVKQIYGLLSQNIQYSMHAARTIFLGGLTGVVRALVRHFPAEMKEIYQGKKLGGLLNAEAPKEDFFPYEGAIYLRVPTGKDPFLLGRENLRKYFLVGYFDPQAFRTISREHAEILRDPLTGRLSIRDLDSKNGTFLNRKKLVPKQWFELKEGDKIRIGGVKFLFGDPWPPQEG